MPEQTQVVVKHNVRTLLESDAYRSRLSNLLGARAPQFATSLIQISQDWRMEKCEPGSVIAAGMIAATLDLPINPQLGFAYIIPYGDRASFQLGYKGYVQLAMRSGLYRRLNVSPVYDGELMKYDRVKADVVIDESKRKNDNIVGFLAYFELTNGAEHALYWTREAVQKHAERFSQAYRQKKQDSPWFTDFDAMGCKTVLKSLLTHWGPLSVQMQTAVVEDAIEVESVPTPEAPKEPKVRKSKSKESTVEAPPENAPAPNPAIVQSGAEGVVTAKDRIAHAGIFFDDFCDFMINQGIDRNIRNYPGYADLPENTWETLEKMPSVVAKLIKVYGKPTN
jgi:recombination protein RecT